MKTTLSKVTIIAERLLKDRLLTLVRDKGATGYTLTLVEGEGSRGVRASDWEGRNVKIESIASPQVADAIFDAISAEYFEDFAVIAWIDEVKVLRGNKFAKGEE